MKTLRFLLNFIFISLLLVIGIFCGNQEDKFPQTTDYTPHFTPPRKLYELYKEDLDRDNQFEFVVLSVVKDEKDPYSGFFNFDLIDIFDWNGKNNEYKNIFSDSVVFGSKLGFFDVNNDTKNEILLTTFSGGEDSINSMGLKIYQFTDNHTVKRIFDSEVGAPSLVDLDNDKIYEIISYRVIYNKFSNIEKINYISQINRFMNGKYEDKTTDFLQFVNKFINEDSKKYHKVKISKNLKKSDPDQIMLYTSFLKTILGHNLLKNSSESLNLWNSEKDFLKSNLDSKKYIDLVNNLYSESLDIKTDVDSVIVLLKDLAKTFHEKKDYKNASDAYEEILNILPDDIDSYLSLGEIQFTMQNYNESINYYLQALLFSVSEKRIFLGLGRSYEKLKDYKEAKNYYYKYLQYDSSSTEALTVKNVLKSKEMN